MKSKRLTEVMVRRLPKPETGRVEYFDAVAPGLVLRVTEQGTKSWSFVFRPKNSGRQRFTLGRYPALSLSDARAKAREAYTLVEAGSDPRRTSARRDTFAGVATDFVEKHSRRHNKPPTAKRVERELNLYAIPAWGNMPIADVTRRDVIDLVESVLESNGPHAARKVRANLRKMFSWAAQRDIIQTNPAWDTPVPITPKQSRRTRILTDPELAAVWGSAVDLGYPYGHVVRMLILTAQRRTETSRIRREHLVDGVWTIPASETKTTQSNLVPLPPQALAVIDSVHPGVKPYLFSSSLGDSPVVNFSRAKKEIDKSSGVEAWTLHDLRRTAATRMNEIGIDPFIVERILNHAISGIASVYNYATYTEQKRKALETWADRVDEIVS